MIIERIEVFLVRVPLKTPFISATAPITYIDTVLVRLESNGVSGWGEVFPGNEPLLTDAWSLATFICIKDSLIPRLPVGRSVDSGDALTKLFEPIKGNRHAKAVIDFAWWDLHAKLKGIPLHKAIGGDPAKQTELTLTFDRHDEPAQFLDDIERAVCDRFRCLTLKIRPGWDWQPLRAVRDRYPTQMIRCDVEGALSMDHHSEMIYRFEDFFPAILEQPLAESEFVGHAMLQETLRTTIALDESITTPLQAEIAVDLHSAGAFCLKPGRLGGLTETKIVHDLARDSSIDCYAGCDLLTAIGYRFVAAVATLPGCRLPADFIRTEEYLEHDLGIPLEPTIKKCQEPAGKNDDNGNDTAVSRQSEQPAPHTDGENQRLILEPWSDPGIGFEPNLELIERWTLNKTGR